MSGTPAQPTAQARELRQQLLGQGFAVLAVIADPVEAGWFTVYVQGPIGMPAQEALFAFLIALPEVVEVLVSDLTPSILRVYREPDALA
jgi:hypothetical protein